MQEDGLAMAYVTRSGISRRVRPFAPLVTVVAPGMDPVCASIVYHIFELHLEGCIAGGDMGCSVA